METRGSPVGLEPKVLPIFPQASGDVHATVVADHGFFCKILSPSRQAVLKIYYQYEHFFFDVEVQRTNPIGQGANLLDSECVAVGVNGDRLTDSFATTNRQLGIAHRFRRAVRRSNGV